MPGELTGKLIVLTGGADGIGYECASTCVREGAAAAVIDRNREKAAQAADALGSDCLAAQADVSEFPAVSLMAKKFHLPIMPHVSDMGQIHRHMVLFNHVTLNHEVNFLEHIPHLQECLLLPAQVSVGLYKPPQEPGASTDMRLKREDS